MEGGGGHNQFCSMIEVILDLEDNHFPWLVYSTVAAVVPTATSVTY